MSGRTCSGAALRCGVQWSDCGGCFRRRRRSSSRHGANEVNRARSSRQRYRKFVEDYKHQRLDELVESEGKRPEESVNAAEEPAEVPRARRGKRREYLREYLRWLWPHRYAVGVVFFLALVGAALEMVEPLFMRFMIDRVLLDARLDAAARLARLHLTGALFLGLIIVSNFVGALKNYSQRVLNTRVMLALRRSLFDRLLHLPLQKLWDMKTGGILSRLTGDVDTTTGLMQMAIVSPAVSLIRLAIAVVVLMALNWRLALTAMAIIPGVMVISFVFAKRVRPIYRSVRKDAEQI